MKTLGPLRQAVDLDVWTGILTQRESPTCSCAINRGGTNSLTALGIANALKRLIKTDEIAHKNVAKRRSLPGEPGHYPVLSGARFYDAQFYHPRGGWMRFKATYDPLTGLLNRGVILDLLRRELSRTRREDGGTTILMGDVDHFKRINDTRGHLVGDEVLREIARRMLASVRSYDFVGRYGGEEFLVVLNNCDASQSLPRGEEIRRAIASVPVQTIQGPIPVTMSLGVLSSRDWGLRPVEELLSEVDVALYKAKAAGRNCVKLASPHVPPNVPPKSLEDHPK